MVLVAAPSLAADISCQSDDGETAFLFSGKAGYGPAIYRQGDERFRVECTDFSCVGTTDADSEIWMMEGSLGVKLDMTPSPDELTIAFIGGHIFGFWTVEVTCETE